jgi:riboflavin kinase/FMN adenylyltransferase
MNDNRPERIAAALPFTVAGEVIRGKQLGSRLGFPTANIRYDAQRGSWPADGVYAGIACLGDRLYLCVLNQGRHPTSPEGLPTVEAHLLDYDGGALYGQQITLEYLYFLRPETTFPSLEALKQQLDSDRQNARSWAARHAPLAGRL